MVLEAIGDVPPRGTLLRRAHELLESMGQPTTEDLLIQHLFGVERASGKHAVWTMLLRSDAAKAHHYLSRLMRASGCLRRGRAHKLSLDEVEFVVIDTETTGLRPGHDRVIEIAGIRLRGGEVMNSFQTLLNPGRRLPPFIVQFTGIKQEMVNKSSHRRAKFPRFSAI